ncbi:hypothetical protein [Posidoniimonas polymericola]|nr:hypothetical protein [Posidoniimonas polymericola]
MKTTGTALSVGGATGWCYDNQTGEFIANSNGMSSDGVRRYSEW